MFGPRRYVVRLLPNRGRAGSTAEGNPELFAFEYSLTGLKVMVHNVVYLGSAQLPVSYIESCTPVIVVYML